MPASSRTAKLDRTAKRNGKAKLNGFRLLALILLSISIGMTIAFIWGNSLLSAQESMKLSRTFERFVKPIALALPFRRYHTRAGISLLTRKLAHFAQFFVLGAQLSTLSWLLRPVVTSALFWVSFLISALVAFMDEGFQFLSAGRAPMFSDVLIDALGAMAGLITLWIPLRIVEKLRA